MKLSKRELIEQMNTKENKIKEFKTVKEQMRKKLEAIERLTKHHENRADELERNQDPLNLQVEKLTREI
jgi:chromosome segregation ATPase